MPLFSSPKFTSKQQIKDALISVNSLDYKERKAVVDALVEEMDYGGVTDEEFKEVMRRLRKDYKISEIDRKYLLDLLRRINCS